VHQRCYDRQTTYSVLLPVPGGLIIVVIGKQPAEAAQDKASAIILTLLFASALGAVAAAAGGRIVCGAQSKGTGMIMTSMCRGFGASRATLRGQG